MSNEAGENENPAEVAATLLGRTLLEALVDEFQTLPDTWGKMSQAGQDLVIGRLRDKIKALLTETMGVLLRGRYPACIANLDRVVFSNGIKGIVSVEKGSRSRHEMADAVGTRIILVMADPDEYMQRMDEIRAKAKQQDLFDGNYDPSRDQPGYRSDQKKLDQRGKTWADLKKLVEGIKDQPSEGTEDGEQASAEPTTQERMLYETLTALSAVDVHPGYEVAKLWSEPECKVALEWAKAFAEDPDTAPARPHWLPLIGAAAPESDEEAQEDGHDDRTTLFFGGAQGGESGPTDTETGDDDEDPTHS